MTGSVARGGRKGLKRVAEIMLLIALVLGARAFVNRGAATGPAPAVEGVALDGSSVSLGSLRGRPVLVHFWATWCPVCRVEEGNIQAVAEDHAAITIATQSGDAEAVRGYLAERGLHLPVVLDEDGSLAGEYGVRGVPASFIIDGTGQIRFVEVGYTTELGLRARLWWSAIRVPEQSNGAAPAHSD